MPRKKLPPRLVLRPARDDRGPVWIIRDGRTEISTGLGPEREREAQATLGAYLIGKSSKPPKSPQSWDSVRIGDVLTWYAEEHAPNTADPARIGYCIDRLAPYFGELPVSAVKGNTCRGYFSHRRKPWQNAKGRRFPGGDVGTIRRELGCLRAALVHAETEGYLIAAPKVWLPEKPASCDRWLTRAEAARLLWAARRTPHLARFILVALYTGTRKTAILRLRWLPHLEGGHVDLEAGLLFRRSAASRETKKRQTPCRIPRKLLGHLRRWHRKSAEWVIDWNGRPVDSIKTSWRRTVERSGIEDTHPHDLKHTAVTWAMQSGVDLHAAAGFFGTTRQVLEDVYGHHHPDFQGEAVRAMDRGTTQGMNQGKSGVNAGVKGPRIG